MVGPIDHGSPTPTTTFGDHPLRRILSTEQSDSAENVIARYASCSMRLRGRRRIALAAVVVALIAVACSGDETEPVTDEGDPLQLSLSAVGGESESFLVQVTLANASDAAVTVVRPFVTPHFVALGLVGPDGGEIPFDGPYPRLEPLTDADVAELAPGESVSGQFDLAEHFAVPAGSVTVSAEYRARENHHGGLALTVDPEDPVIAEPIVIEATP